MASNRIGEITKDTLPATGGVLGAIGDALVWWGSERLLSTFRRVA